MRIYFAGPLFTPAERRFIYECAAQLRAAGFDIVSGGTDNHLMLVDLRPKGLKGNVSEKALVRAGLTCNKNGIPFDPEKPFVTSGIRLGTPACTTRGFGVAEFKQVGALISEEHMRKVLSYIEKGRAEGARVIAGGGRVTDGRLAKGFFVAPTIFDAASDDMAIVREECFGPVAAICRVGDFDAAIRSANDSPFGLGASVFTTDLDEAVQADPNNAPAWSARGVTYERLGDKAKASASYGRALALRHRDEAARSGLARTGG